MTIRPTFKRLVVFQVPERRKLKSGLFVGAPKNGSIGRWQELWVVAASPNCGFEYSKGVKVWVQDGFELYDIDDLGLWDELKDDPAFASLKAFAEECEGDVITKLVAEGSIDAFDEETGTVTWKGGIYEEESNRETAVEACGHSQAT